MTLNLLSRKLCYIRTAVVSNFKNVLKYIIIFPYKEDNIPDVQLKSKDNISKTKQKKKLFSFFLFARM
jgi:hypothetical protein